MVREVAWLTGFAVLLLILLPALVRDALGWSGSLAGLKDADCQPAHVDFPALRSR